MKQFFASKFKILVKLRAVLEIRELINIVYEKQALNVELTEICAIDFSINAGQIQDTPLKAVPYQD